MSDISRHRRRRRRAPLRVDARTSGSRVTAATTAAAATTTTSGLRRVSEHVAAALHPAAEAFRPRQPGLRPAQRRHRAQRGLGVLEPRQSSAERRRRWWQRRIKFRIQLGFRSRSHGSVSFSNFSVQMTNLRKKIEKNFKET